MNTIDILGEEQAMASVVAKTILSFIDDVQSTIGSYAFAHCLSLTEVSFPNVGLVGSSAFESCHNLATVSFPNAVTICSYAFRSCMSLTAASFSEARSIWDGAFQGCSSLSSVSFPSVASVGNYAFQNCRSLTTVSLPKVGYVGNYAFSSCSALMSLYILRSSNAILAGSSAFLNTPMVDSTYTGSFGSIYVPASLVSDYKAANNWSVYSDRITAYVE